MYPAPNQGINQYFGIPTNSQNSDDFDARSDLHLSDKDSIYTRFIYNKVISSQPGPLPVVELANLKINPNSGLVGTGQTFGQPNVNSTIGNASALAPMTVTGGTNLGDMQFVLVTHADYTYQYVGSIVY